MIGGIAFAVAIGILAVAMDGGSSGILGGREIRGGASLARISKGVQEVTVSIGPGSYPTVVIEAGIPVRLTLSALQDDLSPCNETLVIPALGVRRTLVPGPNLLEFTPSSPGSLPYSCWMGMIRSRILVVERLSDSLSVDRALAEKPDSDSLAPIPGLGLGFGPVPTREIAIARLEDRKQAARIRVGPFGFRPAIVLLQRGLAASISFDPEPGFEAGLPAVEFPGHDLRLDLSPRNREASFAEPLGDFTFRTESGGALGYIRVVDELGSVDLDAVRKVVAAYRPAGETVAPCCGY
jgi:hypothetical protein